MISWQLWRSLMKPFVAHPLYQRFGTWTAPAPTQRRRFRLRIPERVQIHLIQYQLYWLAGVALFVIAVSFIVGIGPVIIVIIGVPMALMFAILVAFPFLLGLIGTGFGLACALAIGKFYK